MTITDLAQNEETTGPMAVFPSSPPPPSRRMSARERRYQARRQGASSALYLTARERERLGDLLAGYVAGTNDAELRVVLQKLRNGD